MADVTVEIGHTYAPQLLVPVDPERSTTGGWEFVDTPKAERVRELAAGMGENAVRVALIDDIVPRARQQTSQASWRWQQFLNRTFASVTSGTQAEIVRYESEFVPRAREMVEEIQSMPLPIPYRLSTSGEKLVVGRKKDRTRISMVGFNGVEDLTHPSCQMLDLAWLEYKLSLAPRAVTVLPESYRDQQTQVKILSKLFRHLTGRTIETIFLS